MTEFLFLEENQEKHTTQTKTRNTDQLLNEKKKKKGYFKMRTQDKTKYLVNKQLFIVMIYIS